MDMIVSFVLGLLVGVVGVLWEVRKTLTDDLTATERKVVYTLLKKKARKLFTKFK
jgi:hypothetical protein